MKKFIFTLIIIGIFSSIGLGGFVYFTKGSKILDLEGFKNLITKQFANQITDLNSEESIDSDIAVIQDILNNTTGEKIDLGDLANLSQDELTTVIGSKATDSEELDTSKKRMVPKLFTAQKFFENAFIKFSHPSYLEILNGSLSFVEIKSSNELIGTLNIYSNPEKLSLEDFVLRDNLVNYFEEANKLGLEIAEFEIPTSVRSVKVSEYPGTKKSDIYLIEFEGLIIVAVDFSEDNVVGEYILRSMEKTR